MKYLEHSALTVVVLKLVSVSDQIFVFEILGEQVRIITIYDYLDFRKVWIICFITTELIPFGCQTVLST